MTKDTSEEYRLRFILLSSFSDGNVAVDRENNDNEEEEGEIQDADVTVVLQNLGFNISLQSDNRQHKRL
jgi:hypothetical protein